jgi:hypothetical protein
VTDRPPNEPEVEALQVDRYLETLLLARDRGASFGPYDPDLDPALRSVAERLSAGLVRVHPSFRFEERVARRLADLAAAMRRPEPVTTAATAGAGPMVELSPVLELVTDPARPLADDADPAGGRARPYLIGGALTSAAISLAGAAFLAWRLSRPVHRVILAGRGGSGTETGLV